MELDKERPVSPASEGGAWGGEVMFLDALRPCAEERHLSLLGLEAILPGLNTPLPRKEHEELLRHTANTQRTPQKVIWKEYFTCPSFALPGSRLLAFLQTLSTECSGNID